MASGILTFSQYLGGPDSVQIEQIFPSTQKTLVYNFGVDVTGWTFTSDYQTIVVDQVTFNRFTGEPNFANSTVIGSFAKEETTGAFVPEVEDALVGTVRVHVPAGMYEGPILPDARRNVPITVFSFTWADNATPPQINTSRWAFIQCWEPDVAVGDPVDDAGYTALA